MVVSSNPFAATLISDIAPVLNKEFLDIQATIECRFTLKLVRDMIIIYSPLARNQEFFSAVEVSENKGTSINI